MSRRHLDPHVPRPRLEANRVSMALDQKSPFAVQEAKLLVESKKIKDAAIKYGQLLKRLREKAKMTQYRLAPDAGSDWKHVPRLENGEVKRTRRDTVLRLCQALLSNSNDIKLRDVDSLLKAAGYGPIP